jgi:hypothetical protein
VHRAAGTRHGAMAPPALRTARKWESSTGPTQRTRWRAALS